MTNKLLLHKLTRYLITPAIALLGACGGEDMISEEDIGQQQAAIVGVDSHLYWRCNATSWGVDESTRLKATSDPKVFTLEYAVQQDYMVKPQSGDDCIVTETNQLNGWGTTSKHYKPSTTGTVVVPKTGNLATNSAATNFKVQYPKKGTFKMTVNTSSSTWTYSIQEKTLTRPQTLVQKVSLVIYDTRAQNPGQIAYDPVTLANSIVARIEEGAYESGPAFANVDLRLVETKTNTTTTPKLPSSPAADYNAILDAHGICNKINNGTIDEVWIYADDVGGLYESIMAGKTSQTYNTNGPPLTRDDCNRPVHLMGFNYQRGVAEALEAFGHRFENMLARFLDGKDRWTVLPGDTWFEFDGQVGYNGTLHQKRYCGNAHWAPNATLLDHDYEMNLENDVYSDCLDWNPQHTGTQSWIDCHAWGCTNESFFVWWMKKFPGACKSLPMKKANNAAMPNWWKIIFRDSATIDTSYGCN
jgi:hypothetical protein